MDLRKLLRLDPTLEISASHHKTGVDTDFFRLTVGPICGSMWLKVILSLCWSEARPRFLTFPGDI